RDHRSLFEFVGVHGDGQRVKSCGPRGPCSLLRILPARCHSKCHPLRRLPSVSLSKRASVACDRARGESVTSLAAVGDQGRPYASGPQPSINVPISPTRCADTVFMEIHFRRMGIAGTPPPARSALTSFVSPTRDVERLVLIDF